jgi:hypothetical protein
LPANGSSIANYKVYRGGTCIYTNNGATTSYTDTTVVAPNNYSYTVSAVDSKGHESTQSTPAGVSPCPDQTKPTVPGGFNASAPNCSQINLSWNAASDPSGAQYELVSGLKGYNVFRNGSFWEFVTSPGATDSGLAPGTSYSYQVNAVDNQGNQSAQATAVAVTPSCPIPPAAPASNLTINLNGTTNQIQWTGTPGAPYQVQCSPGLGGPWVPVDAPTTTFGVNSLAVSDQGMYRVALFTNTPAYLANAAVNMADTIAPSVPGNLTVTMVSTSEVDLAWSPSTDTGGSGLAYYFIYRDGLFLESAPATATTAIDTVLPLTDTATYGVAAIDRAGNLSAQAANSVALRPSCSYSLSPSSASVAASGGNGSASVTSRNGCSWSASSGSSWIHTSSSGSGNGNASYTVDANTSTSSRSGSFSVGNGNNLKSFTINQAAAAPPACSYSLSSSSASFGSSGGSASVTVTTGSGCTWTASTTYSWLHTTSSGTGSGTLSFSADPNTSTSPVTGTINVGNGSSSTTLTVTVAGATATCSYSPSSGSASFGSSGGSSSVTVTAGNTCSWTASTTYSWLHTTSSGTGSGTLSFSADPNTSTSPVTGTINVGNGSSSTTLTVTVAGATPTCSYSLSSSSASFGSGGGSSSVTVTAGNTCSWTASTTYSWLHTTSSGTGSGTLSFSADPNTSTIPVTGTINVGNGTSFTTLTVTVAGAVANCTYSLSSGSASFGSSGGSANVTVTTGSGCSWTASTAYSWLHTTSSGTGSGTLSFSVDPNTSSTPLTGTITVGSGANTATLTINEDGAPPTCTYALSSGSASYSASAGSGSVNMTANSGCSWTASTTYSWLHTSSSGSGNGTVNYTVDANTSTSLRSGTITAGGQTLTINQAGTACSYSLSSSNASYSSAGGSASVNVTAGSGCSWTASTTYTWLHTTSSGNGNGSVSYSVDANASSSSRSGTFSVAGISFTVNQSANQPPVANAGANLSVVVGSSTNFSGTASYDPDGSIVSYQWAFGDGATASGVSVSHAYSSTGVYTVTLTVTDNLGATSTANIVATVVALPDTTPPTVSMTAPTGGSTVSNTITVSASASDNVGGSGVASVQFYRDSGVSLGTATGAPYSVSFDTTTVANGSHSFYATATDAAGNTATSTSIAVTVNNAATSPGTLIWQRTITSGQLYSKGSVADHAGNVFVVGGYQLSADFGGGTISNPAGMDAFIVKYDSNNNFVWAQTVQGLTDSYAFGLAVDSQNNVIVTGYFKGTVNFWGTQLVNVDSSGQTSDIFVVKISPAGNIVWLKRFGNTGNDLGYAVGVDASDNVILAAAIQSTVDFGTGLVNGSNYGMALVKLRSSDGAGIWAKAWGGPNYNFPNALAVDRYGDVVVGGSLNGPTDFGGGMTTAGGSYLAKYSGTNGTFLWSKLPGGTAVYGVTTDPNTGNIAMTGDAGGTVNFGGGTNTFSSSEGYIAGYGTSGNYLYQFFIPPTGGSSQGGGIAIDGSGNVALAGTATGWFDFGNGAYVYARGSFVATYTISGTSAPVYRWAQPTTNAGYGTSVAFDGMGHVLTGGQAGYNGFLTQYSK